MELNPKAFYVLHMDAARIRMLDRRAALELLEGIKADLIGRLAAERARVVADEVADQTAYHKPGAKARAAVQLGLSPQRISQMIQEYDMHDDNKITRMAYDFDGELHVMDIDAFGAYVEGSVEVLPLDGDRDMTLEGAGYRTHGGWKEEGEAEGITVSRA